MEQIESEPAFVVLHKRDKHTKGKGRSVSSGWCGVDVDDVAMVRSRGR
jgi:hypothetical protein